MSSERRYVWIATAVVALAVVVLFAVPKLREELAPEPRSALVAVQIDGEGTARVGQIELEAGRSFVLRAVLVAETRGGETVYYTEAPALEIDGQLIDPQRLRRWRDTERTIVLWFTVEGYRPFEQLESLDALAGFRWEEAFRPTWGRGWTVTGSVAPSNPNFARHAEGLPKVAVGSARYHARVERYFQVGDPAPIARYRSPGAVELLSDPNSVTGVVVRLPDTLAVASEAFGMSHLEPVPGSPRELSQAVAGLYAQHLAFSRPLLLGRILEVRGLDWPALEWESIDLQEGPAWGDISAGDLLRSGERVVVLFEDRGVSGRLDYADLCFDYVENAAVRSLGEVFKSGGVLDWADLEADRSEP